MRSCQELFAFLRLSERGAVRPESLHQHGRPEWFERGFQQDCSEFFRYFVDKLQREFRTRGVQSLAMDPQQCETRGFLDPTSVLHGTMVRSAPPAAHSVPEVACALFPLLCVCVPTR